MKESGIYEIRNNVNGKVYIGQSMDVNHRNKTEKYDLNRNEFHNAHLQSAWNKYGIDNFSFNILIYELDKEQLDEYEIAMIKFTKSHDPKYGYNKTFGGEGGKHTDETKKKISESKKGEKNPNWGKKLSEEHRRKLLESNLGKKHSDETKAKISKTKTGTKGKKHSDETKRKISESHQGEKFYGAKLTEKRVRMIKVMLRSDIKTHKQIAKLFGVTKQTIGDIKRGKSWSHIK
jgi:group I intron endonuclease